MKLDVSVLSGAPKSVRVSRYASHLMASAEVGQCVASAQGRTYRVVARSQSVDGTRLRLASGKQQVTVDGEGLSALQPMTPRLARFASAIIRILAVGPEFQEYVNKAIEAAGLPTDPSMNWPGWLNSVYFKNPGIRSLHVDRATIDEAIHAMVIHELYDKKILERLFDPEHASWKNLPMPNRVSAFLSKTFHFRIPQVIDSIYLENGPGTGGNIGRMRAESTDNNIEGTDAYTREGHGGRPAFKDTMGAENPDIKTFEDNDEIEAFVTAFKEFCLRSTNATTGKAMVLITDLVLNGATDRELHKDFMEAGLRKADGSEIDYNSYAHLKRRWAQLFQQFANDDSNGFGDVSIVKMIRNMLKTKPVKKKTQVAQVAALRTADTASQNSPSVQPDLPQAMPSSAPNPNVTQQTNAAHPNNSPSPLASPPSNESGFQSTSEGGTSDPNNPAAGMQPNPAMPEKTIPPEIPGVNHTASSQHTASRKEPMKTTTAPRVSGKRSSLRTSSAAPKVAADRFARLRRIAADEPQEVELALTEFGDCVSAFADSFSELKGNLDLVSPDKTASLKEKSAAKSKYASAFRRLAEEQPEEVAAAFQEAYSDLDEMTAAFENLAENLGIDLSAPVEDEDVAGTEEAADVEKTDDEDMGIAA
jgi:hypothetical protein